VLGVFFVLSRKSTRPLEQWQTYCTTITKLEDGHNYQGQQLKNVSQAKSVFENSHQRICSAITSCMKGRLAWSDLKLIRDAIFVLATQGWQRSLDEDDCESDADGEAGKGDPLEPILRLGKRSTLICWSRCKQTERRIL